MSDAEETLELLSGPRLPAHIYIHVPFCRSKCSYCDFFSVSEPPADTVGAVFVGIEGQLGHWARSGLQGVVETVYVGGGTPSVWPAPVASALHSIRETLPLRSDAEITCEANPESLGDVTVRVFAEAGVTRVSVGVQSFDDSLLRLLGRIHDSADATRGCAAVRAAGLDLCVDLICGVPGQSPASWADTLERAVETGAGHFSVYPLSVEDGTPLQVAVSAGMVAEPDQDAAADMMLMAEEFLGTHGMPRYEVANYAALGRESRHNIAYWTGRSYIGVGPGAHGMLDGATARSIGLIGPEDDETARVRYSNASDIEKWLLSRGDTSESLDAAEAAREDVMLGLRLVRGVPHAQVAEAEVGPVLEELAADGLVELAGGRWRTTRSGWLLGNEVFSRVWAGE
ncbi:MAG: coproporphyrinogen III oxidase [Coriobacteriaceae bacterium]|nr:coproporphyrinogen III oxidase [Coriobacteriaceae bacterium]